MNFTRPLHSLSPGAFTPSQGLWRNTLQRLTWDKQDERNNAGGGEQNIWGAMGDRVWRPLVQQQQQQQQQHTQQQTQTQTQQNNHTNNTTINEEWNHPRMGNTNSTKVKEKHKSRLQGDLITPTKITHQLITSKYAPKTIAARPKLNVIAEDIHKMTAPLQNMQLSPKIENDLDLTILPIRGKASTESKHIEPLNSSSESNTEIRTAPSLLKTIQAPRQLGNMWENYSKIR